ncbi:unnamed protein product (macronuclear) [Paramecium tetraurelia]|uniref:Transmembrane protein n=1 Tax=Paramecium tetraurelia TaxID=5888 RepID=A0CDC1_PARTE|nr:uncharacterized protein GSPATT00006999001 [Paramecium tetraurelia]CAK68788.1 unnamed protein product [Paramecium tetraurelia]|eukprot:XP_001436185.1 hypothetical protein (macronuclear) [Paramecium tetraurelia strain d4-2]
MSLFVSYLKQIDFFGAPLVQQIDKEQSIYKSILGGVMTLLICSASLSYAIWVIYLWQINQFSPKISSSVYVSDFRLLDINYDVIKICYYKYEENLIDPFEAKVLLPLVIYTENYTFTETTLLDISNKTTYYGNRFVIPQMRLGFTDINDQLITTSEMYIQIVKCTPEYLKDGEECATEEISNQFFDQAQNIIIMQVSYKQLNSKDGSIQSSIQEFFVQIEKPNCYSLNTFLQSSFYEVKDSFLFGSPKYFEFVNGALIQPQTNSVQYCQQAFGDETYASLYVVMKGNQVKTIFEYPNAGDLLANIGSIVSILFMFRHLIVIFNSYYLNEKIVHDLITYYYPQFPQIKIYKNWKRDIVKVILHNQQLDLNEYLRFYQNIKQKIEQKLTFVNMVYEISRIYILIRADKLQHEIKKCHAVGLKLDHLKLSSVVIDPFSKSSCSSRDIEEQTLNDEDIGILSLQERQIQSKVQIPDEEADLINFYDINKVKF